MKTLGLYWGSSYESYYFGVIGPEFLNQVPTLGLWGLGTGVDGLGFSILLGGFQGFVGSGSRCRQRKTQNPRTMPTFG